MEDEKYIDESWKESVASEKVTGETLKEDKVHTEAQKPEPPPHLTEETTSTGEASDYEGLDFLSYISSLAFQAMVFLGDIPNPVSHQVERHPQQAKFIIDTLAILQEKTTGNLTKEESDMLNGSLYELRMRYVEMMNKEGKT